MNQDRMREQDRPNLGSNMDQDDKSPESSTGGSEQGRGSSTERNRADSGSSRSSNSGGITNRPLDRERCEQEQIPERGQSQSER